MSIMILHDKTNNDWNSQGLGPLIDAMNPVVTRERNGIYDLTFSYPVKGPLFKELLLGRWIVADAGASSQAKAQRFEIAEITKPIKGIVEVYCEHYRYQLLRSAVKVGGRYENVTAQGALNELGKLMVPSGDFTFFSDVGTLSTIDFTDPGKFKNAQEVLGGVQGSILDNFHGEYLFNNNQVRLMANAGIERNVIIAYGKNLTDISQEESIENTYTSVYGYAKAEEEGGPVMVLPEVYLDSEYVDNYTQRRVKMVDFSQDKPENVEALRTLVKNYIKNNKVGIPKVNIKAKYVDLASSVMGEQLKVLEILDLCDWVTILFNDLEINTMAQIIKTTWNVALDRFDSLELGEASTNMSKVIEDGQPDLGELEDRFDWLEKAQQEASDIIKNPGKGHVVIYPSLADPQEILIMDTMDINTAQNVWRWNAGGLGFSSTGYNGTYGLAMTNNGAIVADRITAGVLRAINIVGVAISASDITGTNIIGGLIKGAEFIQTGTSGTATLGMKYGQLSYYNSESDASVPGKDIARIYGSTSNGGYIWLEAGKDIATNGYLKIDSARKHMFGGDLTVSGRLQVNGNNTSGNIQFSLPLDMRGNGIINQSDIRLKENITAPAVNGIQETKRIQMAEFEYKQNYDIPQGNTQRPTGRQFGVIAQSTPFLSRLTDENNHYLSIDLNKQVNLNTLTNQELIEKVEYLESQLIIKRKRSRKIQSRKGKRCRTKH
ncbi:phage tail spike protein [Lactococcus petauri]|uniref:phage tail spike protein n=1 Tax=Lactococcus petauri TaxID=1940789 RepID=UPI0018AAC232|nr:phage tail spike protein [Lactococcus petauri]MDC0826871.1 phage tail protein [Lactococcus petauri]